MPIFEIGEDQDFKDNKLIIGTHTIGNDPNYLMIAKVKIPKDNFLISISDYYYAHEKNKKCYSAIGQSSTSIELEKKIMHEGEIIRARYMPQNPNLISTKTQDGEIHIFDINKLYSSTEITKPEIRLVGHNLYGKAMSWNSKIEGS